MSLTCDRCFIGLSFLGAFKYAGDSDFDFCKDCWVALMASDVEVDHFRGADTRSCDIGEFVRVSVAMGKYINKDVVL